jgi:hypothetical protein
MSVVTHSFENAPKATLADLRAENPALRELNGLCHKILR